MNDNIHPAESGKINVAHNALRLSHERLNEVLRGVDGVMKATRNLPAKTPPKDVVALSLAEQGSQPAVNNTYSQMTTGLEQHYYDNQFAEIVDNLQTQAAPQIQAPTEYISLTGDEHPNQAAIDEAMLRAMEAYDNYDSQNMEV